MSITARSRSKSAWTPLTHEGTNHKIYEERRQLANKWFEQWTDAQRRQIIEDFMHKSKVRQLHHARAIIDDIAPSIHHDFTRYLPRFLSLYIFSYLDPRSLCRCARVCWYWSWLTGKDELWVRKCMLLGWYLPSQVPAVVRTDSWKQNYIENIKKLQALRPKIQNTPKLNLERLTLHSGQSGKQTPKSPGNKQRPWRGSDPHPTDTLQNNYLDNNDEFLTSVNQLRKKGYYSAEVREMLRNVKNKVNTGLSQREMSKSAPKLHENITSPVSEKPTATKVSLQRRPQSVTNGYRSLHSDDNRRLVTGQGDNKSRDIIDDTHVNPQFGEQPWRMLDVEEDD